MNKLSRILLRDFTAFGELDVAFSPGVNVVIGANGTGKTHLLKVLYAATAVTLGEDRERGFAAKLQGVFNPYQARMTRLIRRQQGLPSAEIIVTRDDDARLKAVIDNQRADARDVKVTGVARWQSVQQECAYIPVKEMLAHAPGFLATMSKREIAFEEVYADIVKRAFLPILRGKAGQDRQRLLNALQRAIEGKVVAKGEHLFLRNSQGELEFTLLAEGMRKLALVWLLIQNGTLLAGSVLFWDEPEANLSPALMGELVEVILELQRMGVQVFLTTHNYVMLKELDLRRRQKDRIRFLALYREASRAVVARSSDTLSHIEPNAIEDTFNSLYDRELARSLSGAAS